MKPTPDQLWKRLASNASPQTPQPADDEVDCIVSKLRWQPAGDAIAVTWETLWWSLTSKFAIPAAAIILIIASRLPSPAPRHTADQVDDLIAATLQQP